MLREQGCQVAARTYRAWKHAGRVVAARTVSDAHVVDAVRDIAWTTKVDSDGVLVRKLSPEGLYGRRKMTAYLRRTRHARGVFWLGGPRDAHPWHCRGSDVTRASGPRSRPRTGIRAGDLLDRDFTAAAPNRTWVTDFTYVRTWAGFIYVAFIVDVFAQRIVAWHAATTKQHRPGDDPAADGAVAARPRGAPHRARRADPPLRCRVVNTPRCGSPSTSHSRASGPRSAPSATPTTTP